jgi:hypothetical protein
MAGKKIDHWTVEMSRFVEVVSNENASALLARSSESPKKMSSSRKTRRNA